jgi:hypothetical protein
MSRLSLFFCAVACAGCAGPKDGQFNPTAIALAQEAAQGVDTNEIRGSVEALVAVRAGETPLPSSWSIRQPLVHRNSLQFVAGAFRALGYSPVMESFGDGDLSGTNVYVDIPGESPQLVIVSGHHDAWFQSGADDNGSAIAVLIEAARAFRGRHPHRSVRIIAFDREEEGMLGATAYLLAHGSESIRIVLNLDCVGYASHEGGSQAAPPGFGLRDIGDFIAILANSEAHADAARVVRLSSQMPQPVETLGLLTPGDGIYPAVGAFRRSDHAPFWTRGIPALFVTDTADYRNKNYHTPDDTPEKLDYDFSGRVAQLVVGAAAAFAEND